MVSEKKGQEVATLAQSAMGNFSFLLMVKVRWLTQGIACHRPSGTLRWQMSGMDDCGVLQKI